MEPPHDSLPVEDDEIRIVFVAGRKGEALLPFVRTAINRNDALVQRRGCPVSHPSVDEPSTELREAAYHGNLEEDDVRPRTDRRPVPFRPRLDGKARLIGEADRDDRDRARCRL